MYVFMYSSHFSVCLFSYLSRTVRMCAQNVPVYCLSLIRMPIAMVTMVIPVRMSLVYSASELSVVIVSCMTSVWTCH